MQSTILYLWYRSFHWFDKCYWLSLNRQFVLFYWIWWICYWIEMHNASYLYMTIISHLIRRNFICFTLSRFLKDYFLLFMTSTLIYNDSLVCKCVMRFSSSSLSVTFNMLQFSCIILLKFEIIRNKLMLNQIIILLKYFLSNFLHFQICVFLSFQHNYFSTTVRLSSNQRARIQRVFLAHPDAIHAE